MYSNKSFHSRKHYYSYLPHDFHKCTQKMSFQKNNNYSMFLSYPNIFRRKSISKSFPSLFLIIDWKHVGNFKEWINRIGWLWLDAKTQRSYALSLENIIRLNQHWEMNWKWGICSDLSWNSPIKKSKDSISKVPHYISIEPCRIKLSIR